MTANVIFADDSEKQIPIDEVRSELLREFYLEMLSFDNCPESIKGSDQLQLNTKPAEKGVGLFMCAIIERNTLKDFVNKKTLPEQLFGNNITPIQAIINGETSRVTYNSWMKVAEAMNVVKPRNDACNIKVVQRKNDLWKCQRHDRPRPLTG